MYTVRIKRQVVREDKRKVWEGVPIEELKDKTLLDYINGAKESIVAALFNEEDMIAVISNDDSFVLQYADQCLSLHSEQLSTLMLPDQSVIELAAFISPDGKVKEVSTQP